MPCHKWAHREGAVCSVCGAVFSMTIPVWLFSLFLHAVSLCSLVCVRRGVLVSWLTFESSWDTWGRKLKIIYVCNSLFHLRSIVLSKLIVHLGKVWYGTRYRRVLLVTLRQLSSNRHRETIPRSSRVMGAYALGLCHYINFFWPPVCLGFGCAAHCRLQWWSHCQVSPSGLAYAECSWTSVHICASVCCVATLKPEGVAQCVSLHLVPSLVGSSFQERRNVNLGSSKWKSISFFFLSVLVPCVSQCIWEDGWLLWSICDWLTKWGQVKSVLISRSDWTLNPFLVSFLSSTCKGTVTFKIFANEGIKMGVYSHTIMRKLQNLNCFYTTFKSQLW